MIVETIHHGGYEEACDRILEESLRRWRLEEESIDDTTFILVIFENKKIKHFHFPETEKPKWITQKKINGKE